MDQSVRAIFEHGVLRPLAPLYLNEDEIVSLVIARPVESAAGYFSAVEQADRQRDILLQFVAKMESLPDNCPKDGLTNRDHDRLIYGL